LRGSGGKDAVELIIEEWFDKEIPLSGFMELINQDDVRKSLEVL
jgi:hypothetical protein